MKLIKNIIKYNLFFTLLLCTSSLDGMEELQEQNQQKAQQNNQVVSKDHYLYQLLKDYEAPKELFFDSNFKILQKNFYDNQPRNIQNQLQLLNQKGLSFSLFLSGYLDKSEKMCINFHLIPGLFDPILFRQSNKTVKTTEEINNLNKMIDINCAFQQGDSSKIKKNFFYTLVHPLEWTNNIPADYEPLLDQLDYSNAD